MNFEYLKNNCISLLSAFEKIKSNKNTSYEWFPVRNKKGFLLELGGTNRNDNLELKAYIPRYEKRKYVIYSNGFTCFDYSINLGGNLEFSTFFVSIKDEWNLEKMLEFLDKTNFKTYHPKIKSYEVVDNYRTIHELEEF